MRPVIEIHRLDEEHVVIRVNGENVQYASHDDDGWAGMDAVVNTAKGIAKAIDAKVIER